MKKNYTSLEHAIRKVHINPQYKKKNLNEDFEYEMARNELKTAIDAAKRLLQNLEGEGDIEAWVQSKITKASDYLDTVADYMDNRDNKKLKEETEEILEAIGIVGSQYKGNDFTQPVRISPPGHSKEAHRNIVGALRTSGSRRVEKQQTSLTMHNKISEGKKDEKEEKEDDKNPDLSSSVKKAAKETGEFAKEMIPFYGTYKSYERTKEALGKGDYGQATLHGALTGLSAAGDVAIASGVGSLVGAGIKGLVGAGARKIAAAAATGKTAAKPATGSTPKLEVPQLKPGEGSAKFPDIPTTKVDTKLEKVPVAANVNKGTKVVQPSAPPNRIEKPTQQMRTTQQEKPVEAKPEPQKAPEKKIDITKPQVKTTIDTGTQKLPGAEVKLPGGKKFAEPTPKTPANVNVPAAKPATTPALTPGAKPAPSVSPAPSAAPSTTPKISPTAKEAPKPSQAKAPVKEPVPSRSPKKGGKTEKSRRLRLPFALPSFGDATPYSGSPHSHTNPIYKHRAKKFSEETRKEIETTARPSNDKYRKNVGRFGKSELTRQSTIQKQIIDEQTKRRAKIVKDVILKNPIPQPEGMGQNSQVDVKPKLNHKFDNSPE